jgi:hypothetical protein
MMLVLLFLAKLRSICYEIFMLSPMHLSPILGEEGRLPPILTPLFAYSSVCTVDCELCAIFCYLPCDEMLVVGAVDSSQNAGCWCHPLFSTTL